MTEVSLTDYQRIIFCFFVELSDGESASRQPRSKIATANPDIITSLFPREEPSTSVNLFFPKRSVSRPAVMRLFLSVLVLTAAISCTWAQSRCIAKCANGSTRDVSCNGQCSASVQKCVGAQETVVGVLNVEPVAKPVGARHVVARAVTRTAGWNLTVVVVPSTALPASTSISVLMRLSSAGRTQIAVGEGAFFPDISRRRGSRCSSASSGQLNFSYKC